MANTFNNYYLNEAGLAALIEKIKANDNKLAELIGLPIDTETGQGFQSIVDRLAALEDADITDQIEDILGYNDPNWPTDQSTGEKLTVQERLAGLTSDVAEASSMGFKSSLWIFSMRACAIVSLSERSLTIAGITERPAILAALQRRSPATIL